MSASLNLKAALLSLLLLACLLGAWHLGTAPAERSPASAAQDEYAKLMGRASGAAKSGGLPTLAARPPPRTVATSSLRGVKVACTTRAKTSWAIRIPGSMIKSHLLWLIRITPTSPR